MILCVVWMSGWNEVTWGCERVTEKTLLSLDMNKLLWSYGVLLPICFTCMCGRYMLILRLLISVYKSDGYLSRCVISPSVSAPKLLTKGLILYIFQVWSSRINGLGRLHSDGQRISCGPPLKRWTRRHNDLVIW
jgi:hypothetical protein